MPQFNQIVEVLDGDGNVTIRLDANAASVEVGTLSAGGALVVRDASDNVILQVTAGTGELTLGASGTAGAVSVRDAAGGEALRLDGDARDILVKDAAGNPLFHFDSSYGALWLGGQGNEGDLVVRDAANKDRIKLDSGAGDIWVKDAAGELLFHFDSSNAVLSLGGQGNEGDLIVRDAATNQRIKLDGGEGDILVQDAAGNPLLHFDSTYAALYIGGRRSQRVRKGSPVARGNEGDLIVRDAANKERIKLDGGEGDIWVKDASGTLLFHFDSQYAALYLGGAGNEGDLILRNDAGNQTIKLDGGLGDILLSNADAAEQFDLATDAEAPPGTVMVLADGGMLTPSTEPYDSKVVGVVAGAGAYRPGIVMDHRESEVDAVRVTISIIGKAACRADAGHGAIAVGDLLTTSPTAGCAMRVADPARAFGAVIGKALTPLAEGTGFVDVLMTLQ